MSNSSGCCGAGSSGLVSGVGCVCDLSTMGDLEFYDYDYDSIPLDLNTSQSLREDAPIVDQTEWAGAQILYYHDNKACCDADDFLPAGSPSVQSFDNKSDSFCPCSYGAPQSVCLYKQPSTPTRDNATQWCQNTDGGSVGWITTPTEASVITADGFERQRKEQTGEANKWDDEWRFSFLMAVLTIGIGNAVAKSIFTLMMERLPHRAVTHKQVESYWQNFRGKLRRQHGLSPGEMPGNRHIPRMEDMPEGLRHLAEHWLRGDVVSS